MIKKIDQEFISLPIHPKIAELDYYELWHYSYLLMLSLKYDNHIPLSLLNNCVSDRLIAKLANLELIAVSPHAQKPADFERKRYDPHQYPVPEELAKIPRFTDVWSNWIKFRSEIKKPLRPTTIHNQFNFLLKNQQDAVEIIEQSIRNGWQGLFPLKNNVAKRQLPAIETKEDKYGNL